jgi:multidrug transporter EmrE-like cation transporter
MGNEQIDVWGFLGIGVILAGVILLPRGPHDDG